MKVPLAGRRISSRDTATLCQSSGVNIRVSSYDAEPVGKGVIPFVGDLDAHTAPMLQKAVDRTIASAPASSIVIDLTDVPFIDSSGLSVIVAAHTRLTDAGAGVRLVATSPRVIKVLALTGLDAIIPTFPTVEAALAG